MSSPRVLPPVALRARWFRVFAALIFVPLMLADTGSAIDPFYDRLLRDGINAYERGDHAGAAQNLRLACFGLLEEPIVLTRGLIYLALAQAELGDEPEFNHTFTRILEIERRFQGFSQLELDGDLRQVFDEHLYRWIALDQLESTPAFADVARRKQTSQMLEMTAAERRPELERLVAAEPENPNWRLLLAELQLESGEFTAVIETTDAALAGNPGLGKALCLRGRAAAAMGSCDQALTDLESCPEWVAPTTLAEARLRCLIQLRDWQSASLVLAEVPTAQKRRQPFRQFSREIKKGRKASPPPEPAVVPEDDSLAPPSQEVIDLEIVSTDESNASQPDLSQLDATIETEPSLEGEDSMSPPPGETPEDTLLTAPDPNDPSTWPLELKAELERTRLLVPSASRGELADAFTAARELADRYPQLTEPQHLAAEIAYRLSRWDDAVTFFKRGGEPTLSHPGRLFYFSVALYETGARAEARRILEQCLPALEMTTFVQSYVDVILGTDPEEQG